jgi:hypothetical protein
METWLAVVLRRDIRRRAVICHYCNRTALRENLSCKLNLIAVVATGHIPVPTAGYEKPEEMEKRIKTGALKGRPVLHLNNLPNGMVVESEALAQLSIEGMVLVRPHGVPHRATPPGYSTRLHPHFLNDIRCAHHTYPPEFDSLKTENSTKKLGMTYVSMPSWLGDQ